MAQVTLPYNLTAGSPENVNNLMSNLTALRDGVNTIDTAQIASDAVTTAKIAPIPYCEITQAATAIGNNAFTVPNLTSTTQDNGAATTGTALADLANDRIILRRTGIWLIDGYVNWAANGAGFRTITVRVNAANIGYNVNSNFGAVYGTEMSTSCVIYSGSTTNYADVIGFQNSGGNLNATFTLKATWLGKLS